MYVPRSDSNITIKISSYLVHENQIPQKYNSQRCMPHCDVNNTTEDEHYILYRYQYILQQIIALEYIRIYMYTHKKTFN